MKYNLVGVDGNAFCVMGYTATALRREGLGNLVEQMYKEATQGDYNNLLCVCMKYVDKANKVAGDTNDEVRMNIDVEV